MYEGEYKEDERHGRGTWRAANGDMWVGGYEVGAKEGVGTWLYADGATSISLYKADEPFGEGKKRLRAVLFTLFCHLIEGDLVDDHIIFRQFR